VVAGTRPQGAWRNLASDRGGAVLQVDVKQNGEDSDSSEDSRPAEPEEDNVVALALDADTSSDKRDAEAAASAYITTRREVDP
jgi:hypothetical protein